MDLRFACDAMLGGVLIEVNKENVRARVPSRSYEWLDHFFQCRECGKVFWEGTHWQRVMDVLRKTKSSPDTKLPAPSGREGAGSIIRDT